MTGNFRQLFGFTFWLTLIAFSYSTTAQTVKGVTEKNLAPGKVTVSGKSGATDSSKTEKKPAAHPFHGKLAAVDQSAKTFTVGKSVYHVNAETKIKKDGVTATLTDGVIGEGASGYVKPAENGTLIASTLNFGTKPTSKSSDKKKK